MREGASSSLGCEPTATVTELDATSIGLNWRIQELMPHPSASSSLPSFSLFLPFPSLLTLIDLNSFSGLTYFILLIAILLALLDNL